MSIQKAGTLKIFSHYIIKDFLDPAILAGAPDEAKAEANSDEKGMCLTIILYGLTIKHITHCIALYPFFNAETGMFDILIDHPVILSSCLQVNRSSGHQVIRRPSSHKEVIRSSSLISTLLLTE